MYALICLALIVVALISKDTISAETMFVTSGLFGIAGAISAVALPIKKEKENKQN